MKKLIPFIILLAFGCKKEDPQPTPVTPAPTNYMIVNGDGHNNERVNFSQNLYARRVMATSHTAFEGATVASTNNGIAIFVSADTPIQASIVDESTANYSILVLGGVFYSHATGTATITKYEAVGGLVECSYSGSFKKQSDTTVVVSLSGHFSVTRQPDQ
jgi:hypothetical protein